ncbi:endonuclease III [Candidatus Pacearchaeota archaeon]|nr:endonuclease III [Candidatus Pacearchaeota archaeon]
MTSKKTIEKTMQILEKHFNFRERTTLNRMRNIPQKNREPFKILISCLISLRVKDEVTEKVSEELFKIAQTPEELIKISDKKLEKILFSSGHYKKKTKTLKSVSKELIEKFNSLVPQTKQELLSIKGIGPKTANIVLSFAFDQQVIPIDTHCHRIPNRLGWFKTKTPEQTETELMKILPTKYWAEFNGIFVLFGKSVCVPVSPFCSHCPVRKYCKRINVTKSR